MNNQPTFSTASIANVEWLKRGATQRVFECLNQDGHAARAVGGCVRNSLFALLSDDSDNCPTVTDIDIATTAKPETVIRFAEAAGLKTVPTGLQHGTITIVAAGEAFEVTTLRRDLATDGRHAEVAFTDDWALDAARRDLTINALYADPDGQIFDPLGGYSDLLKRRVRFVGHPETRIREDYLRILRFFRFYAQYGQGDIDGDGLQACIAERDGLSRLSAERIHQEVLKLLVAPGVSRTVELMRTHGLLTQILPVAPNVSRLNRLIAISKRQDATLNLAALAVHTREDSDRISRHLKLSNAQTDLLRRAAGILDRREFACPDIMSARRLLYELGRDKYEKACLFRQALSEEDSGWDEILDLVKNWDVPAFPITGRDLIAMGYEPGPSLGALLTSLEEVWVRSDFDFDRSRLLEIARQGSKSSKHEKREATQR